MDRFIEIEEQCQGDLDQTKVIVKDSDEVIFRLIQLHEQALQTISVFASQVLCIYDKRNTEKS